ncbi:hypothetical protein SAMN05216474_2991 [Lishizhenia tianjinensis]|uniref:Tetratricopeptide repeat-containing protein n=1 Tax=Lishizhenia tianjinensis TaxID=477690 RepID=A0A1I7BQC8_9FLAO|nr:hypothetical protein [Lishizhenia tianjinensis]SFT89343.1 hypothetical protein SAMN05216474_2991 [Lishizhenia tianjinensis]
MKNNRIAGFAFIAAAGLYTTSCDLVKDVDYTVTPDPLEMHGDSVRVKVDITFPEKSINKRAYAEITPMIGETALKPIAVKGEKATANGEAIPYKAGKTITYTDVVAYTPDMKVSSLDVTGKVFKGDSENAQLDRTKIAEATIVTPLLVNKDFQVIYAADKFERVTQELYNADIHFTKGRHNVRTTELSEQDIKDFLAWLTEEQGNERLKIKTINIVGYASIEGEIIKNGNLSIDRATAAKEAIMKLAAKKGVANEAAQNDASYVTTGRGEDFEGFKEALALADDINDSDKQLVLRILESYKDPVQREQEIKNLGATFTSMDKNIFPMQRRAEINVEYEKTGYTDEELVALTKNNIDTLKIEELMFAATLVEDLNEKLRIYKEGQRLFPNDYRVFNNAGVVLYMQGNVADAKTEFNAAKNIEEAAEVMNNLGAVAGVNGDRAAAKNLLNAANGAGEEVGYNQGILAIQDGDYASAVSNFGSNDSFNKALAQLLNGDANAATATISNSADASSAQGYYLMAIAAARQDDLTNVVSNLKNCFNQDAAYKQTALEDREFLAYAENTAFTAIIK